ncbi:MAG TPA: nicotinate phosphoribosyltransferase [Sulfurihydrogenibium azorense]|uniref:Nicotinate phosphoribosyltransferase n=1 Tax=Sulfurihydrogenibium azorense TaxID=309806 RepID=A0A831YE72_9AQUI|nr:nicotinate phosphoribosyltransferase [Sulfurihydrogenibium azorense]
MRFTDCRNLPLFTDLYELTMAQVYFEKKMDKTAVFNFFIRPNNKRNYFLFAGLDLLIDYLLNLKFTEDDIEFLRSTRKFKEEFLNYLRNFKFTGNLYSVDEGEIVFANEPIIQVEAPIIQAQIIETFFINTIQISILVATKALRCYSVAPDKMLIDFGMRRAHGTDAGMIAARSSYIGGFVGTSNVLAGKEFGIPIYGTMAHSFVMAHDTEEKAFENFASVYPENTIFLIDTYDTLEGVKNAIKVAKKKGIRIKGVRIDSGDLLTLSREVRRLLDINGFRDSIILASGGINEYKIKELVDKKAPIDAFGVGTELVTSADTPYLDCAYKLVEYDGKPKMKLSSKKVTVPYKKQFYRIFRNGKILKDVVSHFDEIVENGVKMLKLYIKDGEVVRRSPPLQEIREKTLINFKTLPDTFKSITQHMTLSPEISQRLLKSTEELKKAIRGA